MSVLTASPCLSPFPLDVMMLVCVVCALPRIVPSLMRSSGVKSVRKVYLLVTGKGGRQGKLLGQLSSRQARIYYEVSLGPRWVVSEQRTTIR